MLPNQRIYQDRFYEGEWLFLCSSCNGFVVEYSFNDYDHLADTFLSNTGVYALDRCHLCNSHLVWAGFSGDMPVSESLILLLNNSHFMASTVILAAITENIINNLFWASLVDSGVDRTRANEIANSYMHRISGIKKIASLTGLPITDISFATRNLVAHGKGFGQNEEFYKKELKQQASAINDWINNLLKSKQLSRFMPSEVERCLLFMSHWNWWLSSYVNDKLLK
jgi:hypothetical protein